MNKRPHICTIKQLAEETGISAYTIRTWLLNGKFKHIRSGKKYLINYDIFIKFLNGEIEESATVVPNYGGVRKVVG